jgi:NADPH:quinone reductase-like Zn-dependent oxidoreductase
MRSIVVDSSSRSRLVLREGPEAAPLPDQAVVRVHSTSLNQGELRYAMTAAPDGTRPGWDFAGVVERAPLVGPGPAAGTRVVGYSSGGAWAQTICVSPSHMAELPDGISTAVASTLPIAGLTALWCLQEGGLLAGRRVLISSASGGVGHMAVQIAAASGAYVVGAVRKDTQRVQVQGDGAKVVIVSNDLAEASEHGPFDLVLESVGGAALANAMNALTREGVCVSFGNSSKMPTVLEPEAYMLGRTRMVGFFLLPLFQSSSLAEGLRRLIRLIELGSLWPRIALEASWQDIGDVAERFMRPEISGSSRHRRGTRMQFASTNAKALPAKARCVSRRLFRRIWRRIRVPIPVSNDDLELAHGACRAFPPVRWS